MEKFCMFLRESVVGVDVKIPLADGRYKTAINFDNAATTPPFRSVMQQINNFAPWYSSVHRGAGFKSVLSSNMYEQARTIISKFVNADRERDVIIFTKSTTEAINMLAYKITEEKRNQVVLATEMEHLANDLPWRYCCKPDYVRVDGQGRLCLDDLEAKLVEYKGRVRLVAVTGASNVTGYINPVYRIARLAHQYGAQLLVDGAQWVPHCPVNMLAHDSPEHIDYLVFSAHKMYAPFGTGVLIGPKAVFQKGTPDCKGGGTVSLVTSSTVDWEDTPARDEAGSPNVMGVLALVAAIRTLRHMGMNALHQYEQGLIDYAIKGLKEIPGVTLVGAAETAARVSLASFATEGIHHRTVAKILSYEAGIAVRSGLFCAHPYVQKLLGLTQQDLEHCRQHLDGELPGLVRISCGLYNTYAEIDELLAMLAWIMRNRKQLIEKYSNIDNRLNCAWVPPPDRKETP